MLLIHIAHSMNRLNLSHLTQFIGILLLCKTEMLRAVPSTQVTLHCQCQCSEGKCFHWRSLSTFHCDYLLCYSWLVSYQTSKILYLCFIGINRSINIGIFFQGNLFQPSEFIFPNMSVVDFIIFDCHGGSAFSALVGGWRISF